MSATTRGDITQSNMEALQRKRWNVLYLADEIEEVILEYASTSKGISIEYINA